jgi:DNA polymerase I-like protein with 3'-5' exonuclease and polymerase domains
MQVYCGLDSCVALEVHQAISEEHGQPPTYDFERALQAPYLDMMLRGFAVDEISRRAVATQLHERLAHIRSLIDRLATVVWDKPLNPQSPKQFKEFFYGAMGIKEIISYKKGVRRVSTDRDALDKIEEYLHARPFVLAIGRARDIKKELEFFEASIRNGRMFAGYNISGTVTGRPSSSDNAFGEGRNMQNIPEPLRYPFIADIGKKLCVIDLEQAEARDFGFLCGCLFDKWGFLDKCEGGDLHTANARDVWPELAWTGHKLQDRKIADQLYYRDFSYRYMAKRLGHLTDYMGTAYTSAKTLKIPQQMAEDFRQRYATGTNAAHPEIPLYWEWCSRQIQTTYQLTTPFGRQRHFFGRANNDDVLREAIAYVPQSMTADRMSLGMWRLWRYGRGRVELLHNGYDSVTFQFDDRGPKYEKEIVSWASALCVVPLRAPNGRDFVIPTEAKTGWNWGSEVTQDEVNEALRKGKKPPRLNTEGLRKFSPSVPDMRQRQTGLQRVMT